jgi:TRAP-type C4-dicarboxylate transport system permease small subunit
MTGFEIYLILQLNSIILVLALICAFLVIYGLVSIVADNIQRSILLESPHRDDIADSSARWKKHRARAKFILPLGVIFFLLALFIPTTKEYVVIKVVPKIVNNEQVQELPDNLMRFINNWLKENTKESEGRK